MARRFSWPQNVPPRPGPPDGRSPVLSCLNCYNNGVRNGISLDHLCQTFDGFAPEFVLPPNHEQLGLIRAFHVKNVDLVETVDLGLQPQPPSKVLNLHCMNCRTHVGWLLTDTIAEYGHMGMFLRDYILFRTKLVRKLRRSLQGKKNTPIEPEIDVGEGACRARTTLQ